jgi:molybdopterin molybdotransferase
MAERSARRADWLSIPEAWERMLSRLSPLPAEVVPLGEALGRTLAEAVPAPIDHPPWDNSAMDGYAVRAADIEGASAERPVPLVVVDDIPAGSAPTRPIGAGEAARIMTGAPVPEGADTVVRVEHTDGGVRTVLVHSNADAHRNIRPRGEDVRAGAVVLEAGSALAPGAIGLLAMVGRREVRVHRRPRVAILATGDELVGPERFGEVLAGRRIADSNSPMLEALLRAAACEPVPLGIAADDRASLRAHLERARGADALITTAGASVGEHDLVKDVLEEMGYRADFWRVRLRPGSPFSFGRLGDLPVFGVAGNPVSVLVTFEVLVRPAMRRLLGERAVYPASLRVTAAERIPGAKGLTHLPRVRLSSDGAGGWQARLTGPQGSGLLSSVAVADALVVVPEGVEAIETGESAAAIPLRATEGAKVGLAAAMSLC